jgi:transposase
VVDGSGDATSLLGPDGLTVECVWRTGGGVRIVQLVTSDPDAARCPECRVVSSSGKEWVLTRPHDVPSGGGAVLLMAQAALAVPHRGVSTADVYRAGRAGAGGDADDDPVARGACAAVENGRDQSEVAAAHGVSWPTVQRTLVAYAARELAEPEPTTVLGMDETRFGRPRWLPDGVHEDGRIRWRRTDPWETGFVDLTGGQALMGQVDGRTSAVVAAWLAQRSPEFRNAVADYRPALVADDHPTADPPRAPRRRADQRRPRARRRRTPHPDQRSCP